MYEVFTVRFIVVTYVCNVHCSNVVSIVVVIVVASKMHVDGWNCIKCCASTNVDPVARSEWRKELSKLIT